MRVQISPLTISVKKLKKGKKLNMLQMNMKFTMLQYQKMADLAKASGESVPVGILVTIAPDGNPYFITEAQKEHGKKLVKKLNK